MLNDIGPICDGNDDKVELSCPTKSVIRVDSVTWGREPQSAACGEKTDGMFVRRIPHRIFIKNRKSSLYFNIVFAISRKKLSN